MSSYKVEICGVNTAKLPVLKEEEMDALFARIKQGEADTGDTYIKGNLRDVLWVIKSIDNFNPALGVKFSTYAVPMIIGEITGICVTTTRSASAVPCATPPTKPSTPARFLPKPPARNRH